MKLTTFTLAAFATAFAGFARAGGDLSRANGITVPMEMGSDGAKMYLKPDHYEFVTGQAYKLVMTNVDDIKHELAINEMFERIFTRKIEAADKDGNLVAEIKGAIQEVEVGPHQTVEWFFVPVQTLEAGDLTCEIPGHKEAGMTATVVVK